jgi:hypothetical protein
LLLERPLRINLIARSLLLPISTATDTAKNHLHHVILMLPLLLLPVLSCGKIRSWESGKVFAMRVCSPLSANTVFYMYYKWSIACHLEAVIRVFWAVERYIEILVFPASTVVTSTLRLLPLRINLIARSWESGKVFAMRVCSPLSANTVFYMYYKWYK